VGEVAPDRLLTNAGLRPMTAHPDQAPRRRGDHDRHQARHASPEAIGAAVRSMTFLNAKASRVALDNGATGPPT
jgi:hypothetical protein